MNHCPDCEIDTRQNSCPLCHQLLSIESLPEDQRAYPRYDQKLYKMKDRLANLAILGGILATVICILINIIFMPHFLWVFYVAVAIFYLLISLNHTILSPGHLGGKIIAQVISLTILLLVIDYMSGSLMWSINYVVPLLILAGCTLDVYYDFKSENELDKLYQFLTFDDCFWFLPLILYFFGLVDVLWPQFLLHHLA